MAIVAMLFFFIPETTLSKFKTKSYTETRKVLQLDAKENENNMCRQAHHGKSFVGNHIHKTLQVIFLIRYS